MPFIFSKSLMGLNCATTIIRVSCSVGSFCITWDDLRLFFGDYFYPGLSSLFLELRKFGYIFWTPGWFFRLSNLFIAAMLIVHV